MSNTKVIIKSMKPKNYELFLKKYENNANNFVDRVGLFFVGAIKRAMQTTPQNITGRSLSGNPPAIDSGLLVNSISYNRIGQSLGKVFTNVKYAEELEFKKNRPFMSKFSQPYINTEKKAKSLTSMIGKV